MDNKEIKSFELNIKEEGDDKGAVEAVFSVFGNVDSDGDVVVPGAVKSGFKDTQVPMVFAHKWDQPIGKGSIVQDNEKAVFKGSFFMETEAGKEAYNLNQWETYNSGLLVLELMIQKLHLSRNQMNQATNMMFAT